MPTQPGIQQPLRIYDGTRSWEGGVDSSLPPPLIGPNQAAWNINRTSRYGYNDTRSGFVLRQTGYLQGLFQGAGVYYADDGQVYAACSIGGRVFLTNLSTPAYTVQEITSAALSNDPNQPHAWFCQATRNLVIQDNQSLPIFWNGVSSRRSNGNATTLAVHEVPTGSAMAYNGNIGRLFVAQGSNYVVGDIVYGDLTLTDPRDSVLQFTENDYLNEGGAFSANAPITGMTAIMNIDSQLGYGDVLVGTATSIYAFNAPPDRTTWKNLNYPIQRVALQGYGPVSSESMDVVNGDVYFRSHDSEVRSYYFARRDFQNQWGNTPLSRQIDRAIDGEGQAWMYGASGVSWNQRYLFTVQPQRDPAQITGVYFLGLGVLDFFFTGGVGPTRAPAWDGVWTGLQVFQVFKATVNGNERCFLWVRNPNSNTIELWEIDPDTRQDYNGAAYVPVQWSVETKSFPFVSDKSSANDLKALQTADIWFDQCAGAVTVSAYYKPDSGNQWFPWGATSDCSVSCVSSLGCAPPVFPVDQSKNRIGFQIPGDLVTSQGTIARWGYDFQARFDGTGAIRMKTLRIAAQQQTEDVFGNLSNAVCVTLSQGVCPTGCPSVNVCQPNDYTYSAAA